MVSCALVNCKNSSNKLVKMCRFPKKRPEISDEWIKNCKKYGGMNENWHPGPNSMLCEYHFTPDMWEKKEKNKKLKKNAVPTVFGDLVCQMKFEVKLDKNKVVTSQNLQNIPTTSSQESLSNESENLLSSTLFQNVEMISIKSFSQRKTDPNDPESTETIVDEIILDRHGLTGNNEVAKGKDESTQDVLENDPDRTEKTHDGDIGLEIYALEPDIDSIQSLEYNEVSRESIDREMEIDHPQQSNICDQIDNFVQIHDEAVTKDCTKCEKFKKMYIKSEILRKKMKRQHHNIQRAMKNKIKKLEVDLKIARKENSAAKIFQPDQLSLLNEKYKKIPSWCDTTIVKAFQLKFACGNAGYKELLRKGHPLPSLRTLSRKIEHWQFKSGHPEETLQFLQIKGDKMDEKDKYCLLVLDEIHITEGLHYDPVTKSLIGHSTFPGEDQTKLASRGLVFMLAGVAKRWKQIFDYYYTTATSNGAEYVPIVVNYIRKIHSIGFHIVGVVSDMGSSNMSMWKYFNIGCHRYSMIKNKCPHPAADGDYLYFFHDSSHAFKNVKEGLINCEKIVIPQEVASANNLPTNTVFSSHLKQVIDVDNEHDLKLAPKLDKELLEKNRHFLKMRVKSASHVLSHEVSTALQFLAEELNKPELITSAWLVGIFAKWFKIMSSRSLVWALSKNNFEKFQDTVNFLYGFVELIRSLNFGSKNEWKPYQKGLVITTVSFIEVSANLIDMKGFQFVLGGRFTQDCIENLFSILRMKNCILNALQFRNNLKLISISQYMRSVSCSSYDEDDGDFLPDFFKVIKTFKQTTSNSNVTYANVSSLGTNEDYEQIVIDNTRMNILFNVAGYLIRSITKNSSCCKNCILSTGNTRFRDASYSRLTFFRCFDSNTLFFINHRTMKFFVQMEKIFESVISNPSNLNNPNLQDLLVKKFLEIPYYLPQCHNLKEKISKRFAVFRLKIRSKKKKESVKKDLYSYGSKTMTMHKIVK